MSHYRFKSFDSLTKPIQAYADWLWKLKQAPKDGALAPAPKPKTQGVSIPATPPPPPHPPAPRVATQGPILAATAAPDSKMNVQGLTGRERDILEWFVQGHVSPKYIAAQLGISVKTVQWHRERLMGKLQLRSTPELVRYVTDQRANMMISTPAVMGPMIPVPMPFVRPSRPVEREEWPG